MSSLREKLQDMVKDDNPEEYDRLILDEVIIDKLTPEDKAYLETFKDLQMLSMCACKLNSLENFPDCPKLAVLKLSDNNIAGAHLTHLNKYKELEVLKMASNKITSLDDVKSLGELKKLRNLDLLDNDVTGLDGYKEAAYALSDCLEVLDGYDKEGKSCFSEDDEDYGEEGEFEQMEGFLDQGLTDEQLEELKRQGITPEEFMAGKGDFDSEEGEDELEDYGEEDGAPEGAPADGEDDYDDEEAAEGEEATKRAREE